MKLKEREERDKEEAELHLVRISASSPSIYLAEETDPNLS